MNAYASLEVLSPVNKPIAPHCKVLRGPVPVQVLHPVVLCLETWQGVKVPGLKLYWLRGGCFAPLVAWLSPSEPLLLC